MLNKLKLENSAEKKGRKGGEMWRAKSTNFWPRAVSRNARPRCSKKNKDLLFVFLFSPSNGLNSIDQEICITVFQHNKLFVNSPFQNVISPFLELFKKTYLNFVSLNTIDVEFQIFFLISARCLRFLANNIWWGFFK
jgi:hypothetical protein